MLSSRLQVDLSLISCPHHREAGKQCRGRRHMLHRIIGLPVLRWRAHHEGQLLPALHTHQRTHNQRTA